MNSVSRARTKVIEAQRLAQEILSPDQPGYAEYKSFLDQLALHSPAEKTFRRSKAGDAAAQSSLGSLSLTGLESSRVLTIILGASSTITVRWSCSPNTPIVFSPSVQPLAVFYGKVAPLFGIDLRSSRDELSNILHIPLPADLDSWFSISIKLGTAFQGAMADLRGICAQLFLMGKLNTSVHFDIPYAAGVDTINTLALYPSFDPKGELSDVTAIGYHLDKSGATKPHLVARVFLDRSGQTELLAIPIHIDGTQLNGLPLFLSHMFQSGLGISAEEICAIAKPKTHFTHVAQTEINLRAWYNIGPSILLEQFLCTWVQVAGMTQYNLDFNFSVEVRSDPRSDTSVPYTVKVTSIIYSTAQAENLPGVNVVFGPKEEPQRHKLFLNGLAPSGGLSRLSGQPAAPHLIRWIITSLTCQLKYSGLPNPS